MNDRIQITQHGANGTPSSIYCAGHNPTNELRWRLISPSCFIISPCIGDQLQSIVCRSIYSHKEPHFDPKDVVMSQMRRDHITSKIRTDV